MIPNTVQKQDATDHAIPSWIKDNAKWWADGITTDSDFVKGIKYLVEEGIINVSG